MRLGWASLGLPLLAVAGCAATATPDQHSVVDLASQKTVPSCAAATTSSRQPGARPPIDSRDYVSFVPLPKPFRLGGSRWQTLLVDPGHPITYGVTLKRGQGVLVDSLTLMVKPYAYSGGDDGLQGAVFHVTWHQPHPSGQTYSATFRGLSDSGAPVPPGVYKVMVEAVGQRVADRPCEMKVAQRPLPHGSTGMIFGLARVSR